MKGEPIFRQVMFWLFTNYSNPQTHMADMGSDSSTQMLLLSQIIPSIAFDKLVDKKSFDRFCRSPLEQLPIRDFHTRRLIPWSGHHFPSSFNRIFHFGLLSAPISSFLKRRSRGRFWFFTDWNLSFHET